MDAGIVLVNVGIYQAATGMGASLDRQSVIATNLARMTIPGARQSIPAFEVKDDTKTLGLSAEGENSKAVSRHLQIRTEMLTDFRPGPIVQTGTRCTSRFKEIIPSLESKIR